MPRKGYAPGWQIRCAKCGTTCPAADVEMIRIGAWSRGKRMRMRCNAGCGGKRRWMHVERAPEPSS